MPARKDKKGNRFDCKTWVTVLLLCVLAVAGMASTLVAQQARKAKKGDRTDSVDCKTWVTVNTDGRVSAITQLKNQHAASGKCIKPALYFSDAGGNIIAQLFGPQRCVGPKHLPGGPAVRKDPWKGKIASSKVARIQKVTIVHFTGSKDPWDLLEDLIYNRTKSIATALRAAKSLK